MSDIRSASASAWATSPNGMGSMGMVIAMGVFGDRYCVLEMVNTKFTVALTSISVMSGLGFTKSII